MLEPLVGNDQRNTLLYHTFRGYTMIKKEFETIDISKEDVISGTSWYNVSVILRILFANGPMTQSELLRCHFESYRESGVKFSKNMDEITDSYRRSFGNQLKKAREEYKVVRILDVRRFKDLTADTWEDYNKRINEYAKLKKFPVFPYPKERYEKLISHHNHIIYIPGEEIHIRNFLKKQIEAFESLKQGFPRGARK